MTTSPRISRAILVRATKRLSRFDRYDDLLEKQFELRLERFHLSAGGAQIGRAQASMGMEVSDFPEAILEVVETVP